MADKPDTQTVGFEGVIKPYFTPCYRAHMLARGPRFDLWSAAAVQRYFPDIYDSVEGESMPASGCPEGVWDAETRARFLVDFQAWKDGGYQP